MKRKKLILLTSEFPYGNGETFLETEIEFLARGFDEIVIYSSAISTDTKRDLPKNVSVKLFSSRLSLLGKLKAFTGVFTKEFKSEKKRVVEIYNLDWTKNIRNTALVSLFIGKRWKQELEKSVRDSEEFDLTFYSYWCTDSAIGLSLLQRKYSSIKTFSRVHGWDLYFEATSFNYQPFRDLIAKNLTGLYPISDMGKEYIKDQWKVEPNSIQVARLGTLEMPKNEEESNRNILVSCSNLVSLKRVHLIAESLNFIDKVDLDWFHFGDGLEFRKVEELVNSLHRDGIKVHLMGRKDNCEILDWFGQNNPSLFVNVSTTEGIPVSIMEAMSFGTPVFATNVGGTSEIVDSENGQLLNPSIKAEVLGEYIQEFFLLKDEEQAEFRKKAYETWDFQYNGKVNYELFTQTLLK